MESGKSLRVRSFFALRQETEEVLNRLSAVVRSPGSGTSSYGYVIEKEPPVVAADVQVAKAVSAAAARCKAQGISRKGVRSTEQ